MQTAMVSELERIAEQSRSISHRVWLNSEQAAEYTGTPSAAAWRAKSKRLGIKAHWFGGLKVWKREDIDASIENGKPPKLAGRGRKPGKKNGTPKE